MTHKCPVARCGITVDDSKRLCPTHWHAVPRTLQNDVWRTYRNRFRDRRAHLAACKAAIDAVNLAALAVNGG